MTTVPREITNQHVAILGKTRSGKSSVMRLQVERLIDEHRPVCVIDPKGDWWGLKLARDGKSKGYPVIIFGGPHADIPIDEHAGAQVAELFAAENRPCLIDLGGWMPAPRTKFWIEFASTLFRQTKGSRWLAIDEVHNFAPKGKVFDVDSGKALHWTNRLASEGLGKGLQMLFASQRPQKVHNDTLTSAETLIAMRVLHPSDRGAVADWIKGCGDSEGSEVLNSLAQMERGEGWVWSPEIGFGPQRVKFPIFKTYDSFRPQTVEDSNKLTGWADVDIEEIREKFRSASERAQADDPKELRKQILVLKQEIVALKQQKPEPAKAERVEVSILTDDDRALLKEVDEAFRSFLNHTLEQFAGVKEYAGAVSEILKRVSVQPAALSKPISRTPEKRQASAPVPPLNARREVSDSELGKCERAILQVLSQFPEGCDAGKLTLLAGYTYGGGFRNSLGILRTLGLITGGNTEIMSITEAGLQRGPFDPLPDGEARIQFWLNHRSFGQCERRILQELVRHSKGMTAEQLCEVTGYTYGGGFRNSLGKLRTAGVIVGKNTEVMRASETLFE